ncbi:MAG: ABC transporter permease subunit/CPBP intramembrane protease [Pirellulales bacterium]
MKFANVKLIFQREVRDQLRDRRTLFMIFVLPLLLYPLLGMSFFQVVQFMREHPSRVKIIGLEALENLPNLVEQGQIAEEWLDERRAGNAPEVELEPHAATPEKDDSQVQAEAEAAIKSDAFQVVVYFPPDFANRMATLREKVVAHQTNGADADSAPGIPQPVVYFNGADEKSQFTYTRVVAALRRWTDAIGERLLREGNLPAVAAHPFEVKQADVAAPEQRQAVVWSKILPFVLFIWALTGAFYPAIDLCAGEKERGTLETLLSSPAERSEIVTGKLLTIMLFSVATAVLNIVSMGLCGAFLLNQMQSLGAGPAIGMPPAMAPVWLLVALIPVAALFSALCLALAAFARSNKEGQYYLMPLLLVSMPLMILPMAPGVELTFGNSLIPLTGLVLLLRSLLEGQYLQALPFVPPVVVVTGLCCVLALRWAIEQFNKENVLFRESERVDLGLWLRHLIRDRQDTPSAAEAVFCGVLILVIEFFIGLSTAPPQTLDDLVRLVLISQLVVIATPPLLMTVMLTRRPLLTLLLRRPPLAAVPLAMLLAIALHPLVLLFARGLSELYPIRTGGHEGMLGALEDAPYWLAILLFAVVAAFCEELAFRGFILSGLRHLGHRWRAILISALFFGITHQILQQSIITAAVGAVIGYIAVQAGSLWPCIAFHATHNALMLVHIDLREQFPVLERLVQEADPTGMTLYQPAVLVASAFLGIATMAYFVRLSPSRSPEEALQEAIDRSGAR